jgi:hypothetical protein
MDDLISRQAAIEAIGEVHPLDYNRQATLERIKALPSAQPERKRGRWEYVDYGGFGNWHCTACRKICICNGDFDYCPNCGAEMKER